MIKIIKTIGDMKSFVALSKKDGKSIGLVPTMGGLHAGHLSLVRRALSQCDVVVVSIFVNPTQFGAGEDFAKYPRDLDGDRVLIEKIGGHVLFCPSAAEMYPDGYSSYVNVKKITDTLCGKSRPGHFEGVATIVLKLFNIVAPDKTYFGQKDAQQLAVIERMTKDLNLNTDIIACPTVREKDGLAMSSRNVYLTKNQREKAIVLYDALCHAIQMINLGEKSSRKIKNALSDMINSVSGAVIDYVDIVKCNTLESTEQISADTLIAVAVNFGSTRLIDNVFVR